MKDSRKKVIDALKNDTTLEIIMVKYKMALEEVSKKELEIFNNKLQKKFKAIRNKFRREIDDYCKK